MWLVLAQHLRAARQAKGLTLEQLEESSGVARRTIQRWEARDTKARPELVRCVATALDVEATKLARPADVAARETASAKPHPPIATPASVVPERERLHELALLEARHPTPKARADGTPWLLARDLHALYSAYALREGERFAFRGRVSRRGAAGVDEAALVGAKAGTLSCFVIERAVDALQLAITVLTPHAQATRALERHVDGAPVTIVARVLVAPDDAVVFTSMLTGKKRAWTLVVEGVEVG